MLGGVSTAVETVGRGLRALGHEVVIVAPRMTGAVPSDPVIRVPAIPAPTYPDFALPLPISGSLRRQLLALDLDVFHAHHPFLLGGTARRLARATGRPFVFTHHTLYDKYSHYVPLPRAAVARCAISWTTRFANTADLVLAPSAFVADRLRAQGVRRPITVMPTGTDLDRYRPGSQAAARRALGLPEGGGRILLYVGRLDREKNLEFLLDAVARIRARGTRLVLVGKGTRRATLEQAAATRGLGGRVEFPGSAGPETLAHWYRAADLFVFASTTETQGLAALEAMASGLPVVAIRASGVEEAVIDGVSGLLVPEEPAAFAAAVDLVLSDPDLARKLGAGGREAADGFAEQTLAARLVQAYRGAFRSGPWS